MSEPCGVYVDGFNLYHGIDTLGLPHLKWLDLNALGHRLAAPMGWTVRRVVYCTALDRKFSRPDQTARHRAYDDALRLSGVERRHGTFAEVDRRCRASCRETYRAEEEKQSDTNLALAPIRAMLETDIRHHILVTGDSDQAPTLRFLREFAPKAQLIVAFPPNRGGVRVLADIADRTRRLDRADLELCLLPEIVRGEDGRWVKRPDSYAPP